MTFRIMAGYKKGVIAFCYAVAFFYRIFLDFLRASGYDKKRVISMRKEFRHEA